MPPANRILRGDAAKRAIKKWAKDKLPIDATLDLSSVGAVTLPDSIVINGSLRVVGNQEFVELPRDMKVGGYIFIDNCKNFVSVGENLHCHWYICFQALPKLEHLSAINVRHQLTFNSCENLSALPDSINAHALNIIACPKVSALPALDKINYVYLRGTAIKRTDVQLMLAALSDISIDAVF